MNHRGTETQRTRIEDGGLSIEDRLLGVAFEGSKMPFIKQVASILDLQSSTLYSPSSILAKTSLCLSVSVAKLSSE
jgi:hypothetical protein